MQQIVRPAGLGAHARHVKAAKGLPVHQGACAAAVEVQVAHAEFPARLVEMLGAAAEHGTGQGKARVIGPGQGLIKIAGAHHGQHRAKDLFLCQAIGRGESLGNGQGHKVALFGHVTLIEDAAFLPGQIGVLENGLVRLAVDHCTHVKGRIFCRTDFPGPGRVHQALHEPVVHGVQYDQSRTGRTLLALEGKRRIQHSGHCHVQVRIVIDNDGILAAHFADDLLDIDLPGTGLSGPFNNTQAHFHGACKGDQADRRMVHQEVTHHRSASRCKVKHAVRQTCLLKRLAEYMPHDGRQIGWFEDHTVACHDGGRAHAAGNGQGKIPRRDHRANTLGLIEVLIDFTRRMSLIPRLVETQHFAGVVVQEINGLVHIIVRLAPLLALFQDLPGADFVDPAFQDLCGACQDLGPRWSRHVAPCLERALSRLNGLLDLVRTGLADPADHLVRLGRVDGIDHVLCEHVLTVDVQRIRLAQPALHIGQGLDKTVTNPGIGQVGQRRVAKCRLACLVPGSLCTGFFPHAFDGLGRVFQQALHLHAVHKGLAQERFIGRVLQ